LIQAILEALEFYFEEWWWVSERRPIDRMVTLWQLVEDHNLEEPMGFWFVLLGKIFITRNHAPWAESRIEAAIERIRDQGDAWTLGTTLLIQSYLFTQFPSGKLMENLDRNLQEALAIFRELGAVYEQGEIISIMAENALLQKRPLEDVVDLYQQAQQFCWKLNDLFGVATIYQDLGNLFFMRGRPADGFQAYHEARRIFEQLGRQYMVMGNLFWEGLWAIRYSTYEHALEMRQRLVDYRQYIRRDSSYIWNIYELGDVHRIYGYKKKALECYEEARTYFERINVVLGLGYCQRGMGDIAMQEGRYADALKHYQAYRSYAERDNHAWSMAQASARLASLCPQGISRPAAHL
jgi:tetratricopeptide (TPR) repeat protein